MSGNNDLSITNQGEVKFDKIPPNHIAKQDNTKVVINFKLPPIDNGKKDNDIETSMRKICNIPEKSPQRKELETAIKNVLPEASDKFIDEIEQTAQKLKCSSLDLAALIFKESQFNPSEGQGSYKGLGQMNSQSLQASIKYAVKYPDESQGIDPDMTIAKFIKLSREEQMPYVRNYALTMKESYFGKEKEMTGGDLYALFYTPGFVKKHVLTSKDSKNESIKKMYKDNKNLDKIDENNNRHPDGKITKEDLQYVLDSIKTNVFKVHSTIKHK